MGVGDWIPAGGKGHALLEVTGNVGNAKGRNMYRRKSFRRGRQFGGTKFAPVTRRIKPWDKWWFTYVGGDGAGEPVTFPLSTGANTPQVVVSLEGQNLVGSDNARGSEGQVTRWIGRDGFISLGFAYSDDASSAETEYSDMRPPWATALYAWFKFKQDFAQTLPSNIAAQFGMQTGQNLGLMLQRKDIMKWGMVDIPRRWNSQPFPVYPTGGPEVLFEARTHSGQRPRAFLPFPRFPRGGFKIEPNDIVMCIMQMCDTLGFGTVGTYGGVDADPAVYAMPMFRCLMAR